MKVYLNKMPHLIFLIVTIVSVCGIIYLFYPETLLLYQKIQKNYHFTSTIIKKRTYFNTKLPLFIFVDGELFLLIKKIKYIPVGLAVLERKSISWSTQDIKELAKKNSTVKKYFNN